MHRPWFSLGALWLAFAVGAGALGAHALRGALDAHHLELWQTACRYLVIAGIGLLATGLAAERQPGRGWGVAGALLMLGSVVFSGTVAALAFAGPNWLGAVTPVGGVMIIAGFVVLALVASKR